MSDMPIFKGPLAAELERFLSEKRRTGHKYSSESYYLSGIDCLSIQMNTNQGELPRELVEAWTEKRDAESYKTWSNRIVIIRQLARYLKSQEKDAYQTTLLIRNKRSTFIPHIYTDLELRHIFEQADNRQAYTNCPNRREVASLIFRLIYSCGLRVSESLMLDVKHVDIENDVIIVLNSKFGTNRYVPMSPELTIRCQHFMEKIHAASSPDEPLFPAPSGIRYSKRGITNMFHQILFDADISRTSYGPRIHDLRHTFSVNCLKKWVREGKDLTAALPVLSTYLGHKGLSGTQDYLRLTAEMFPDIISAVEKQFGDLIPKGGDVLEE